MSNQAGKFVWYDLMTTDKKASLAFYTELFGWTHRDFDMGPMGTYTMVYAGETGLGGLETRKPDEGPSHWMAYISVPDVDKAAAMATRLGGKICVPPTDIPNVGRFAVMSDPQGATFSAFKAADDRPARPETCSAPGTFCWNELLTSHPQSAVPFYGEIFGWSVKEVDMGPGGLYWLYKSGDKDQAGMMKSPPDMKAPPFWLPYIAVANTDASTQRAQTLGAVVRMPPMDIPKIGRFSVISDPTGAVIALFQAA